MDEVEQLKDEVENVHKEIRLLRMDFKRYHMDFCNLLEDIRDNTKGDENES